MSWIEVTGKEFQMAREQNKTYKHRKPKAGAIQTTISLLEEKQKKQHRL